MANQSIIMTGQGVVSRLTIPAQEAVAEIAAAVSIIAA